MDTPKAKCVNCGVEQPAAECKLCFSVLVCAECDKKANIIYDRARTELRTLLVLLQETIRIALVEGRLSFAVDAAAPVSKAEVLRNILGLMEGADANRQSKAHRSYGIGIQNQMPVSWMPGSRSGVASRDGGLASRFDHSGGSVQPVDRSVPDLQALHHDGDDDTGVASAK